MATATDEEGLLGRAFLLPLVEPTGRHQTALRLERLAVSRLLREGLSAGVDHAIADCRVFGPVRYQPPAHEGYNAFAFVLTHHGCKLGGRNVKARSEVRLLFVF